MTVHYACVQPQPFCGGDHLKALRQPPLRSQPRSTSFLVSAPSPHPRSKDRPLRVGVPRARRRAFQDRNKPRIFEYCFAFHVWLALRLMSSLSRRPPNVRHERRAKGRKARRAAWKAASPLNQIQYVTGSAPGDAFSVAVKLHHLAAERNDGPAPSTASDESLGLGPR